MGGRIPSELCHQGTRIEIDCFSFLQCDCCQECAVQTTDSNSDHHHYGDNDNDNDSSRDEETQVDRPVGITSLVAPKNGFQERNENNETSP